MLVFGKGRKERWMPLGNVALEALWEYLQLRETVAKLTNALWVDQKGKEMKPDWLRRMLKRVGDDAGVPNLHPHRFRHSYAVNALRAGMPERVFMLNGGWRKIPETYFRTLGEEDVARFHREMSPGDRLGLGNGSGKLGKRPRKARGRL
jgi:site-specific recombinase XerD